MTEETPIRNLPSKDGKKFSNVLKVKADSRDATDEERSDAAHRLAGAIAHGLRQFGEIEVRCIGFAATFKGAKCLAIASGLVATKGFDLYCRPHFIIADIGGKEITGISFLTVTSQLQSREMDEGHGESID